VLRLGLELGLNLGLSLDLRLGLRLGFELGLDLGLRLRLGFELGDIRFNPFSVNVHSGKGTFKYHVTYFEQFKPPSPM